MGAPCLSKLVRWRELCLGLSICLVLGVPRVEAQQTLGSLNGTVLDSSGGAVPGA